ncbi:MAG TPA: hypothetical protein VN752_12085 [Solirubrobacterales bacterium]|nr:hypothetical protein [Solirubrobacterales bacterium]
MSEVDDRAVQILIAEYQYVSGLIPFYRRAELIVLAATGALLSVMVAALATLEAAEEAQRHAEGILLTLGAWVPVLLLLIEAMALTRLMRASRYILDCLNPIACDLGQASLLEFERSPGAQLLAGMKGRRVSTTPKNAGSGGKPDAVHHGVRERFAIFFFSSTPVIMAMVAASIGLALGGIILDFRLLTLLAGGPAAVSATAVGLYAISTTHTHESRGLKSGGEP